MKYHRVSPSIYWNQINNNRYLLLIDGTAGLDVCPVAERRSSEAGRMRAPEPALICDLD